MQERARVSSMDLKAHMNNLRKNPKFTEEILKLVESDLQYGLTIEETEMYTLKRFDYAQMKVYSACLRNGYPEDVRECITRDGLTGEQMAVALEFYEKGVPLKTVAEVTENSSHTAFMMKKLFQSIVSKVQAAGEAVQAQDDYAKDLLEQIKSVVEKIEFQEKRYDALNEKLKELQTAGQDAKIQNNLLNQLAEKDSMLEKQQDELNEATVVNMSTYTDNYVNPLDMDVWSLDLNDSKGMIREKGEFMLGLCEQCMGESLNSRQKSIIDRCVRKLYIEIARSREKYVPVMSDFYDILMNQPEEEAKDIALSLELFVNGSLNIFNHQTNVDVDNRFTVYGIRDLGTELSPITMLVMMESIQNRIIENGKRGIATWLYIDEFHVLLNSEYSAKYLQQLWKKVRKQGGLCTGITQNVVVRPDRALYKVA